MPNSSSRHGGIVTQRWQALKLTLERSMNKNAKVPSSPGSSSCHSTESDSPPKPKTLTLMEPTRHWSRDDFNGTNDNNDDKDNHGDDDDENSTVVTTPQVLTPPSYSRILIQRLVEERTRAAILAEHEARLAASGEEPRRMTWEEVEAALKERLQKQPNHKHATGIEEYIFDESVYDLFFGTNEKPTTSTAKTLQVANDDDDDDDDDANRNDIVLEDDDPVEPGCDYVPCTMNPWTYLVEELTCSPQYQAVEEFVVTLEHRATEDAIDSHNAAKRFFSAMCLGSEAIPTE